MRIKINSWHKRYPKSTLYILLNQPEELKASVPITRRTAHNRKQATIGSFELGVQILSTPKRGVQQHNCDPNEKGDEDVQPHVGENQSHYGDDSKDAGDYAVVDDPIEEDEGPVAEEVEEEPGDEDEEEDD